MRRLAHRQERATERGGAVFSSVGFSLLQYGPRRQPRIHAGEERLSAPELQRKLCLAL